MPRRNVATPIDDADDPRVADVRNVRDSAGQRGAVVVVEGAIAVARALSGGHAVRSVIGIASQLAALPQSCKVPLYCVSAPMLRQIVGYPFRRGVVAAIERPAPTPSGLEALLVAPKFLVVVLERLADPANVGAIIRTAAALHVDLVVCDAAGADPYDRRALRASMGHALVSAPWIAQDVPDAVARLAATGADIVATTTDADATDIKRFVAGPRTVLLLGNEGVGLSEPLARVATRHVTIRIRPGSDSLNVAAATAIVIHALR